VCCEQANGFLGARGPAGGIPAGYTLVASEFLKQVQSAGQENRIQMAEFQKQGWTYHVKGLWYTLPGHHLPNLTFIGSPNFGKYVQHSSISIYLFIYYVFTVRVPCYGSRGPGFDSQHYQIF
jgi:hypothetical protein